MEVNRPLVLTLHPLQCMELPYYFQENDTVQTKVEQNKTRNLSL